MRIVKLSNEEAKETHYWLELIRLAKLLPEDKTSLLLQKSEEIVKILIVTLRKLKLKRIK